jgi:hypothetical protein
MNMKLVCETCKTIFDAAEKDTLEKLLADHKARFHNNKQEQVTNLATAAKSMAFSVANGAMPKRKDARLLVALASQVLNEPIPEMPDDVPTVPATAAPTAAAPEQPPAQPSKTGSGSGEGKSAGAKAGDDSKKK